MTNEAFTDCVNLAAKPLATIQSPMSDDDDGDSTQAGLRLMVALGGVALLIFLLGVGVIYYLSYLG